MYQIHQAVHVMSTAWGVLGTESSSNIYNAHKVPIDLGDFYVESADLGKYHICAVSSDATLKCWGGGSTPRIH